MSSTAYPVFRSQRHSASRPHPLVVRVVDAALNAAGAAALAESLDFHGVLAEILARHVAKHQRAAGGKAEIAAGGHANHLAIGDHRLSTIDRERRLQREAFEAACHPCFLLLQQGILPEEIAFLE